MLLGHELQLRRIGAALVAFFAFSFCASLFYVLNDLLDIEVDRSHPRKRKRPFAAGDLSIKSGLFSVVLLVSAVVGAASFLPPAARALLALYAALNFAYSIHLKQVLCLDVVVLAFLYTLRILFGGVATSISVSIWTLAFSIFVFLGLALLKRLTELRTLGNTPTVHVSRRPYVAADLSTVQSFASSALYLSVLVLAFYINSPDVLKLYHRPEALWFVCLLMIFWVSRMLMLTNRGNMTDDPIVFAFKDNSSRIVGVLTVICVLLAL
jgi:4-hydroxybenzoate polyprenyltransferase